MTGEVAFGLVEWLSDVFAFRNSTQFSEGLKKKQKKTSGFSNTAVETLGLLGAAVTCVPCVVAG